MKRKCLTIHEISRNIFYTGISGRSIGVSGIAARSHLNYDVFKKYDKIDVYNKASVKRVQMFN